MNVEMDVKLGKGPLFKTLTVSREGDRVVLMRRNWHHIHTPSLHTPVLGDHSLTANTAGGSFEVVLTFLSAHIDEMVPCHKSYHGACLRVELNRAHTGGAMTVHFKGNSPEHQRAFEAQLRRGREEACAVVVDVVVLCSVVMCVSMAELFRLVMSSLCVCHCDVCMFTRAC